MLSEVKSRLSGLMGFRFFRRTDNTSEPQPRRRSSIFRRRSRHSGGSREERSTQNENNLTVQRPIGQCCKELRRSREIGEALRAIGDDLNNSTLSLHSAT
ncbi:hypothetical protein ACROYT_G000497 [Oculina patagonica]